MPIYMVFLRGVMPSGKNRVPMSALQEALWRDGFAGARTFLHTGNILLRSDAGAEEVVARVREVVRREIGPDLAAVARTPEEIDRVLRENPFDAEEFDISRVFFALLSEEPEEVRARETMEMFAGEERLKILDRTAYMYIPGSAARSKLGTALLEKKLGIRATARNANTLGKMLSLAGEV